MRSPTDRKDWSSTMANDKRDSSKRPSSSRTGASGPAKKKAPARSSQTKKPAAGRSGAASGRSGTAARSTGRPASSPAGSAKKPAGTRKKNTRGRKVVIILLVVLIVISLLFIFFTGRYLYLQFASPKDSVSDTPLSSYDTTPETDVDKVAYFAFGLMGATATDPTELLSLVCYDKQAKTIRILEIPMDTYLGDSDLFAVKKTSEVWANPKPVSWCEYEAKRVYSDEIVDGKHTYCGQEVTEKAGSASGNLISIFNEQYAMPVDNFFLLPQEAFVKLVDLVDGVDVQLDSKQKLDGITYEAGVQTLGGQAALEYVLQKDKGVKGDIDRIVRQRRVMLALFQRLSAREVKDLKENIIGPLMNGSTPIRCNSGTGAMRSMLIHPSNKELEEMTLSQALSTMLHDMGQVSLADITAYVIPGEAASANSVAYYSVHRAELATLLASSFNPYGIPVTEASLQVTELAVDGASDTHTQAMSEIAVAQSGMKAPEESSAA